MKHGKKISALLLCAALGMSSLAQAKDWTNAVSSLFTPDATGNLAVFDNSGELRVEGENRNNEGDSQNCVSGVCQQQGGGSPEDININVLWADNSGDATINGTNQNNGGNSMNCVAFACAQQRGSK